MRTANPARQQAKADGKTHYLSDTPCPHGHTGLRYTCNSACVECVLGRDRKNYRAGLKLRYEQWSPERQMKHQWLQLRGRAKTKGIPFTITWEDVRDVWPANNRCPVLGIPLQRSYGRSGGSDASPSLDRLDPKKGYVPGNIAVISYRANKIKQDATSIEVEAVLDWMVSHGL